MHTETATSLRQDASVISLVAVAHTISHFFHLLLPSLFPWLKDAFAVSYVELGLLVSVFFTVSSVVQFSAGFAVDRFGARIVLLCGLGFLTLSAFTLSMAQSYTALLLGAAIAGLGNGVFHPADLTLLNKRVSPSRLGHAFSVHTISGTLGWALAPAVLIPIAVFGGWRTALLGAGLIALTVLVVLFLLRHVLHEDAAREAVAAPKAAAAGVSSASPAASASSASSASSALGFMRDRGIWLCFGFFFVVAVALSGVKSFSIPALGKLFDVSLAAATTAFTAYMLASAVGTICGGFVASRAKRHDRTIAYALGASGAMSLILATGMLPFWLAVVLMAAVGFGAGFSSPSRDLLIRAAAPKNATGRVYGVVYSGLDVGFSIGPLMFGLLMDAGMVASIFILIGLFQMAGVLTAGGVGSNTAASNKPATA